METYKLKLSRDVSEMFEGMVDNSFTRAEMRLLEQTYVDGITSTGLYDHRQEFTSREAALCALKRLFVLCELFALEQRREGVDGCRSFFLDEKAGVCIIENGEGKGTSKIEIV